jgi:putative cell wall-binding protein
MGIVVDRLAGDTRWDTAALVAAELGGEDTVVASGVEGTLVDALSAGGPAANGGWAILLTERDEVPAATQAALEDRGGERVVVGGPMVVSDAVVDQIGAARAGGSNRYETATETSTFFEARGVPTASIALASGEDGHLVDALAGGALGQLTVLTRQDHLPDETTTWITDRSDGLDTVNILGGEVAVSENVADEVRSILE